MTYFRNIPFVQYKFGNTFALHQDISAYVDIIDQFKSNISFYEKYTILDGDRPDNLSQKLYENSDFYWTFFLMNDHIRQRGWPLSNQKLLQNIKNKKPNTVITTHDDITSTFLSNSIVSGLSSGSQGKILSRNLDLGQITIEGSHNFISGENLQEDAVLNSILIESSVSEHLSVCYYEDENGDHIDIDPYIGPGSLIYPVTYHDEFIKQNDELKQIIVIKQNAINDVYEEFQSVMSESIG